MNNEELIQDARAALSDVARCRGLGITPSSGHVERALARVLTALESIPAHPLSLRDECQQHPAYSAQGEPREVTTVEELDALPVGTVVRERDSGTFCGIITVAGVFEKWAYDAKWHVVAGHGAHDSGHIDLPARILCTPSANGGES